MVAGDGMELMARTQVTPSFLTANHVLRLQPMNNPALWEADSRLVGLPTALDCFCKRVRLVTDRQPYSPWMETLEPSISTARLCSQGYPGNVMEVRDTEKVGRRNKGRCMSVCWDGVTGTEVSRFFCPSAINCTETCGELWQEIV